MKTSVAKHVTEESSVVMSGVGPGACNKGQPAPRELLHCKSIASFAEKLLKDVFWKKNPSHASGVPAQCLAVPAQPLYAQHFGSCRFVHWGLQAGDAKQS